MFYWYIYLFCCYPISLAGCVGKCLAVVHFEDERWTGTMKTFQIKIVILVSKSIFQQTKMIYIILILICNVDISFLSILVNCWVFGMYSYWFHISSSNKFGIPFHTNFFQVLLVVLVFLNCSDKFYYISELTTILNIIITLIIWI